MRPNCHDQKILAKFNLSILYSQPYEKTARSYEKVDTELIRRAIDQFEWLGVLPIVNVDDKVSYFKRKLLNIIHNFIPHDTFVCDDRDPAWMLRK